MPLQKITFTKSDMRDSEQWLLVFNDLTNSLNVLGEEFDSRNKLFKTSPNSGNLPKINSEIRRQFKSIERVLIDLKETLPAISNEISKKESLRRKDELQNLIRKEQEFKKMFDNPATARNTLLDTDDVPIMTKKNYSREEEPEAIRDLEGRQILVYQQKVMDGRFIC